MKRSSVILASVLIYIVAMIGMFWGVEQYIKSKDNKLRNEIHNKISALFKSKTQYVDIAYSGYKVGFEKIPIPAKPKPLGLQDEDSKRIIGDLDRKSLDEWTETYGDLTEMYRTHYKRSDWAGPYDYEDGWNLCILEHDYQGVYQTWIFPYAVGYIKQDYYFGDSYLPSIASAVNDALEFYTTNEKSSYYGTFEKGCINKVWSDIYDASNEYYHMQEDEHPRFQISGTPLFNKALLDNKPQAYQNGYMYNGYYKVFIALTQPKTWTIKKWASNPDLKEKQELWKYWSIGLTVLLLLIIIPLWAIEAKHKKIKNESLYDKLKRMCNPVEFMNGNNYDKEKVDRANAIYKRLSEISSDDTEALNEIQIQAVTDLGINLIDVEMMVELKEKVNPKKFMNPYNPDKVALANELFAALSKEGLTYNEFVAIKVKSKRLYDENNI